jgi:hypothetical protein
LSGKPGKVRKIHNKNKIAHDLSTFALSLEKKINASEG